MQNRNDQNETRTKGNYKHLFQEIMKIVLFNCRQNVDLNLKTINCCCQKKNYKDFQKLRKQKNIRNTIMINQTISTYHIVNKNIPANTKYFLAEVIVFYFFKNFSKLQKFDKIFQIVFCSCVHISTNT